MTTLLLWHTTAAVIMIVLFKYLFYPVTPLSNIRKFWMSLYTVLFPLVSLMVTLFMGTIYVVCRINNRLEPKCVYYQVSWSDVVEAQLDDDLGPGGLNLIPFLTIVLGSMAQISLCIVLLSR